MNIPKNHHYVPQFYLRNFASDGERRTVSRYLLSERKSEPSVYIRSQCSEEFFYGNSPTIEKALGDLESRASVVIRKLLDSSEESCGNLPPEVRLVLLGFAVFQLKRTPLAADQVLSGVNEMFQAVAATHPDPLIRLDAEHMIVYSENAVLESLSSVAYLLPFVFDLSCRVLVNSTSKEFITSDHPVVTCNLLDPGRTGLARPGVLLYLPLSPARAILWYDAGTIKIDKKSGTLVLTSEQDVRALNQFIALGAEERLFSRGGDFSMHWVPRPGSQEQISHGGYELSDTHSLLKVSRRSIAPPIQFGFVRLKRKARGNKRSTQELRDPAMFELLHQFLQDSAKPGNMNQGNFIDFLANALD